jgi:hypothetical protein
VSAAFSWFRCGDAKKSKLITVYNGDWSKRLCNGCYGRLLSIYEIKAGTGADDQRAEELAVGLLSAVALDEQRQAERPLKIRFPGKTIKFWTLSESVETTK